MNHGEIMRAGIIATILLAFIFLCVCVVVEFVQVFGLLRLALATIVPIIVIYLIGWVVVRFTK